MTSSERQCWTSFATFLSIWWPRWWITSVFTFSWRWTWSFLSQISITTWSNRTVSGAADSRLRQLRWRLRHWPKTVIICSTRTFLDGSSHSFTQIIPLEPFNSLISHHYIIFLLHFLAVIHADVVAPPQLPFRIWRSQSSFNVVTKFDGFFA